jgi:DNA polymerase elongation subunit (family B)
MLDLMCSELRARGVTLLEADTDGVYFAVPAHWTEADERRVVTEVAALLPPLVHLEFEGRYRAMLSHQPKNYALLGYDGHLTLRGVAFRSSRAEPYGEEFLRRAIACVLRGDVSGVRAAYVDTVRALYNRALPTRELSSRVRLTRTPTQYEQGRATRRELAYDALLAHGRTSWRIGERIRVYRTTAGGGLVADHDDEAVGAAPIDPRDYDVDYYVRLLRRTFAARLVTAFSPDDFDTIFANPDQLPLFPEQLSAIRPVLNMIRI